MRSQLPWIRISTIGLQTFSLSAWVTVMGAAVPWNPAHRIAAGYAPISPEYAFCPPASMDPAPWPCICQYHGSRLLLSAAASSRTVRGSDLVGPRSPRVPMVCLRTPPGPERVVMRPGTPFDGVGDTFEIAVVLDVMIAGRNMG